MIWPVPTDNVIKEKHFNGFHLNEKETIELLKLINNKIAQITEKGMFREATPISNVLATSIYGEVKKEYRFGCKICTENIIQKITVHTLTQTKDQVNILPHQREVLIQKEENCNGLYKNWFPFLYHCFVVFPQ